MAFYVVGIGGTGAKFIEAMVHLASIGLIPAQKLSIFFVDADETNGNLQRAQGTINIYKSCYEAIQEREKNKPWMTTSIESHRVWSPLANANMEKKLASLFGYNTLRQTSPPLANLFSVLYTEEERNANLEVGFRGHPAIGAGIISQMNLERLEEEPWRTFIRGVEQNVGAGEDTRILLCGSVFGGTGASGLPTIGRLLAKKLERDGTRNRVKIGCIFGLPYFSFPKGGNGNEVFATPELFLLNTEAALRYYREQATQFDVKYLLGSQSLERVGEFSVGKESQVNRPHFVELYAALAARHFFCHNPQPGVYMIARNKPGEIIWDDLPEKETVKALMTNAVRFAFIWLADFHPQLRSAPTLGISALDGYPWFDKFFQGTWWGIKIRKNLPDVTSHQQQEIIKAIGAWCHDFLRWLAALHRCEYENIRLFKTEHFASPNSLQPERISELFWDDTRGKEQIKKDNPITLKNAIGELPLSSLGTPNQGAQGLAKAIYACCKI
ncbi:MAG: hypothetical protein N3D76_07885 [Geminocystis sp.]|nr:hypothetical protein [Geminocystis sp.]HIK36764.1 hypothetical protein [Geminocystis sp. M7585_C2015_104]